MLAYMVAKVYLVVEKHLWKQKLHIVINAKIVTFIRITNVSMLGVGKQNLSYIEKEEFTPKLIKEICDLRPRTIFGYEPIKAYYEEYIPRFLDDLKRYYNDIFKEFINSYPEYNKPINYVGRKAYINTLNNGSRLKDCHSNIWIIEEDEIVCYELKTSIMLPFSRTSTKVRMKITDDMICEVTDNEQVNENTRFYN